MSILITSLYFCHLFLLHVLHVFLSSFLKLWKTLLVFSVYYYHHRTSLAVPAFFSLLRWTKWCTRYTKLQAETQIQALYKINSCILRYTYSWERFKGYAVHVSRNDEQYHFLVTTIESAKVPLKWGLSEIEGICLLSRYIEVVAIANRVVIDDYDNSFCNMI